MCVVSAYGFNTLSVCCHNDALWRPRAYLNIVISILLRYRLVSVELWVTKKPLQDSTAYSHARERTRKGVSNKCVSQEVRSVAAADGTFTQAVSRQMKI